MSIADAQTKLREALDGSGEIQLRELIANAERVVSQLRAYCDTQAAILKVLKGEVHL